jgi:hypothetical protein
MAPYQSLVQKGRFKMNRKNVHFGSFWSILNSSLGSAQFSRHFRFQPCQHFTFQPLPARVTLSVLIEAYGNLRKPTVGYGRLPSGQRLSTLNNFLCLHSSGPLFDILKSIACAQAARHPRPASASARGVPPASTSLHVFEPYPAVQIAADAWSGISFRFPRFLRFLMFYPASG